MTKAIYKIAIIAALTFISVSWYFGAFLPFKKAQLLIISIQRASGAKSLNEFENYFFNALDFYSPIGQAETIKHTSNSVFNLLNQANISPEAAAQLLGFVDKYAEPMLRAKKGDGLIQQFYIMGDIYRVSGFKYKNRDYLNKAAEIYTAGLELAPKRPQFLYGLLQIYLQQRNAQGATEITRKILQYWPDDPAIKKLLQGT